MVNAKIKNAISIATAISVAVWPNSSNEYISQLSQGENVLP